MRLDRHPSSGGRCFDDRGYDDELSRAAGAALGLLPSAALAYGKRTASSPAFSPALFFPLHLLFQGAPFYAESRQGKNPSPFGRCRALTGDKRMAAFTENGAKWPRSRPFFSAPFSSRRHAGVRPSLRRAIHPVALELRVGRSGTGSDCFRLREDATADRQGLCMVKTTQMGRTFSQNSVCIS